MSPLLLISWEKFPLPRSWGVCVFFCFFFVISCFRSQSHGRNVFFNLRSHPGLHLLPTSNPCLLSVLQHLLDRLPAAFSQTKWIECPELLGHCCWQLNLELPTTAHSEGVGANLYSVLVWTAPSEEAVAYWKAGMGLLHLSQMCQMVGVSVV